MQPKSRPNSRSVVSPVAETSVHTHSDFYQIVPNGPVTAEQYDLHRRDFYSRLTSSFPKWPLDSARAYTPYPIYSAPHRALEMQKSCALAQTAFTAIIQQWWSTPRFQSYIPLVPKIERVLRKLDLVRSYENVGAIRADILIPGSESGATRICEINARFMFNGFFLATLGVQQSQGWDFCKDVENVMTMDNLLHHYDRLIDKSKPAAVLIKKGLKEIHCLVFFQKYYPNVRLVDPSELRLIPSPTSPSGVVVTDNIGIIEQIMLELHQDEIEALDEELLVEIGKVCWNDLRTIYFAHDKRMLGLIRRELPWLVQCGVITTTQEKEIENGLVETYTPSDEIWSSITDRTIQGEKDKWVLKKCLAGKGDGMLFGKDMTEQAWKKVLKEQYNLQNSIRSEEGNERRDSSLTAATGCGENSQRDDEGTEPSMGLYVIQRYVEQRKSELIVHDLLSTELQVKHVRWNIVGSAFGINGIILPLMYFRTSASEVIAVASGGFSVSGVTVPGVMGELVVPAAVKDFQQAIIQPDARILATTMEMCQANIEAVKNSLTKYGLAVVDLQFDDPASEYMVNITKHMGEPLGHSSKHGILWDVRPVAGMNSTKAARSHTMEQFPWHTDCSFEDSPPRYFGLHVIRKDRHGGGKLRLVHTESILENISCESIDVLQSSSYKIKVPQEFHKDVDHIVGPLLSSDGRRKLRYRQDIIEPLTSQAAVALEELERSLQICEDADGIVKLVGGDVMKDGCIILLDNARWLHARTPVNDPKRWLRRVRWGPEKFFQ